jgi:hypothetical protein
MPPGFDAPKDLPPETPSFGRKSYALLFLIVALVFLLAIGLENAQLIPASVMNTCRAFQLCGPSPLKPLPPLATGWLPSGSTWESASRPTLEKYQQENPDYDISFHQGQEHGSCDGKTIKMDCQYRFEGSFTGTPKWRGLLETIYLSFGRGR